MKQIRIFFLIICFLILISCQKIQEGQSPNLDFRSFNIVKKENIQLNQIGKIDRVVKLESTKESVFAEACFIQCNQDSDFLIGDYESGQKVFCFDKTGKFLRTYGKPDSGPGEHSQLSGFAVGSDDSVILLSAFKLTKFSKEGKLLAEKRVKFLGQDIYIVNDLIYISLYAFQSSSPDIKAIQIFDSNLNEIGGIVPFDPRMTRFALTHKKTFASLADNLFFIDCFDFRLNQYHTKSKKLVSLTIPSKNSKFDSIWNLEKLTDKDTDIIFKGIHRFDEIHSHGNSLFLYECCLDEDIKDFWLLNLNRKKGVIYPFSKMDYVSRKFFVRVEGSYDTGAIIAFDLESAEELAILKKSFKEFEPIEYNPEDNPILILFRFNEL